MPCRKPEEVILLLQPFDLGTGRRLSINQLALVVEIGTQFAARNSSRCLDCNYTLSRHLVPVGYRRLGNTDFSRELGDAASFIDRAR